MKKSRLYIGFFMEDDVLRNIRWTKRAGSMISDSLRLVWDAVPAGCSYYLYLCVFAENPEDGKRTGDVGIWKIRGNGQIIHYANAWEEETVLSALASVGGNAILRGACIPHPHPNDPRYNAEWLPKRWAAISRARQALDLIY